MNRSFRLAEGKVSSPNGSGSRTILFDRRWPAVIAYHAIIQTAHAVAADLWNEHPHDHFEVRDVIFRIDSNLTELPATVQEVGTISIGAIGEPTVGADLVPSREKSY